MAHAARVSIPGYIIADALHLPEGTRVLSITANPERLNTFEIVVENEAIPISTPDGFRIPEARPIFMTEHKVPEEGETINVVSLQNWGIM